MFVMPSHLAGGNAHRGSRPWASNYQRGGHNGRIGTAHEAHRRADEARGPCAGSREPRGGSRGKAKADLEDDIDSTRASAEAQADKLRAKAEESRGSISAWWTDVQKSWDAHVAELRDRVESKKAERDVHLAQRRAENTEADAEFAVDFAYGAVVEAEYAVLDAVLARTEADELTRAGATA